MVSSERESLLPRVAESDLLCLVFDDVTDKTHRERWQAFAGSNRVLAREILMRAHSVSGANPDIQKKILDEVTYIYAALAVAALRLSGEVQPSIVVGDDDEYQQPLV